MRQATPCSPAYHNLKRPGAKPTAVRRSLARRWKLPDVSGTTGRANCMAPGRRRDAAPIVVVWRTSGRTSRDMSGGMPRRTVHYAWVVAAVTFVVLLATAGVRATPGVLMVSLENEFGWSRAVISGAVAINIALFGLIGPFAASVMDRFGLRRVILVAVALLSVSVALTTRMHSQWELILLWGV